MQVTITIHDSWFTRPRELRRALHVLAGLELPPGRAIPTEANGYNPREDNPHPEPHVPARTEPDRGDAYEEEEGEAPTDGRQLLGWAAKQTPDAKGAVMSWGKKKGYASKIVTWSPDQVLAAYHYARGTPQSTCR
jgi:hypothetical protein